MGRRSYWLVLLALGAAASAMPGVMRAWAQPPHVTRYLCTDGRRVDARYPPGNTAVLVIDGRRVTLRQAPSADGGRYIGQGRQWWAKGMRDATLSVLRPGQTIADGAGVSCHAPR
jgi:membrane-bound inhibitor of C-type lysozyme